MCVRVCVLMCVCTQVMKPHDNEKTFEKFGIVVLYHVSFFIFISTIGLNIIFGIIVDTFSELRDLKVSGSRRGPVSQHTLPHLPPRTDCLLPH